MNAILSMLVIGALCYVIVVRLTPSEMRRIADYLNSRADSEDWFLIRRGAYREQRKAKSASET